jgi:hypothetical protein
MNKVVEIIHETRKEWSPPELKKVDIEQITAGGSSGNADLDFTGNGS